MWQEMTIVLSESGRFTTNPEELIGTAGLIINNNNNY